jgi:tetratricopeptide (TPR) repeat protein
MMRPAPGSDSLLLNIKKESNPEKKLDLQLSYVNRLFSNSPDAGMRFTDSLLVDYEKHKFNYAIARTRSLKSWFLFALARYEESLKLGHNALAMQLSAKNDSLGIALTLNRIGCVNMQYERYEDAKKYLLMSLDYFLALKKDNATEMVYNNLGVIANEENKIDEAIAYYKKALAIRLAGNDYHWIAYAYYNIGDAYLSANQLDSAKMYLFDAVKTFKEKTKSHKVPPMVTAGVAQYYQKAGNNAEALKYARTSVHDAEASHAADILIGAKGLLAELLYDNAQYKEAYETHDEFVILTARRDSAGNAAAISEIEEKYKNSEKEKEIAVLSARNLEAENKAQRISLFAFCVVLGAAAFAALVGFKYMKRRQQQKLKESDFHTKLAEVKLIALRAQMNPHFVFNCINTAQSFILNEEKEQGYEYLSDFARLLRMILENSGQTFVALENEIKQVKLYMALESARFHDKFSYELDVEPALENAAFEVPGMILQPFIENAILHGLVNRPGHGGLLSVKLSLQEETVFCEIKDNGVGREKAAEIKRQKDLYYRSSATPNIIQRLEILNQSRVNKISFNIVDLYHGGNAAGTLVKVHLPFK